MAETFLVVQEARMDIVDWLRVTLPDDAERRAYIAEQLIAIGCSFDTDTEGDGIYDDTDASHREQLAVYCADHQEHQDVAIEIIGIEPCGDSSDDYREFEARQPADMPQDLIPYRAWINFIWGGNDPLAALALSHAAKWPPTCTDGDGI